MFTPNVKVRSSFPSDFFLNNYLLEPSLLEMINVNKLKFLSHLTFGLSMASGGVIRLMQVVKVKGSLISTNQLSTTKRN